MFSSNLRRKSLPWQHVIADSTTTTLVLHKFQILGSSILSKGCNNEFSVGFCGFLNAESSNLFSKTGTKKERVVEREKEKSRFVSYLVNSCGLSRESAVSASKKIRMKTAEEPISIISLLLKNGFDKAQIANLLRVRPSFLAYKAKTLLPKIEFFNSIGMPKPVFAAIANRDPTFLCRSLEKRLIPNYNFLKCVLLTNERVVSAMNRTTWIFLEDVKKNIAPNIEVLKEFDVLDQCIRLLLANFPEVLIQKTDELRNCVAQVVEMGFDPSKAVFVLALHSLSPQNRATWARSYEAYTNWGWSEDDIHMAFRKHPNCMLISQMKISKVMDFLVNKMGCDSKSIARCPSVLLFSLEKRIVPRCSVMKLLFSRKLVEDHKLRSFLAPADRKFLDRYVFRYADKIPKLYDVYKGEVSVEEL